MKIRHTLTGSLMMLGAAGLLFGPGCADNRSSVYIQGALAMPPDTCATSDDPSGPYLPSGTLDLALSNRYWIAILVANQLVRRGNASTLRTETSTVIFHEAEVTLTANGGEPIADGNFATAVSGFAEAAASGTEPGYGVVYVDMIDATSAAAITPGQLVVANVILRGESLGNIDIETDPWAFPIAVCDSRVGDCLVNFPPEADDPARAGLDCDVREEAPEYCRKGMDFGVDCRACADVAVCAP